MIIWNWWITPGRIINPNKRGHIPEHQPPILKRLELSTNGWLAEAAEFEERYQDNHQKLLLLAMPDSNLFMVTMTVFPVRRHLVKSPLR
ncbi:hypothetical protein ACJO2E_08380 [Marinobacter sp. M1N3S26]|uniref:hypothetical protein n=1 Tax=Marinobacter sp. M1N3S26 TaxID=3382299 RepID=UPI00387B7024